LKVFVVTAPSSTRFSSSAEAPPCRLSLELDDADDDAVDVRVRSVLELFGC